MTAVEFLFIDRMSNTPSATDVLTRTRDWLDKVVIGLNLCPFAKAVQTKDQIRFVVSNATAPEQLLHELEQEMRLLAESDPTAIDTTLLIHPQVLNDFLDYNDFLDVADALLEELELDGVLQVASFHPDYRFAGTHADDIANCTNRSPWPILHLLREDSVARAVAAFPDAATIYERNIATLRTLGSDGWRALMPGVSNASDTPDKLNDH